MGSRKLEWQPSKAVGLIAAFNKTPKANGLLRPVPGKPGNTPKKLSKMPRYHHPDVIAYVVANYKFKPDIVLAEELKAMGYPVNKTTIGFIKRRENLIRTPEEKYIVMAELVKLGLKKKADLYPAAAVEYVKANFRTMPNKMVYENLQALGFIVSRHVCVSIMNKHDLKRTPEDLKAIMKVLVNTGVKRNAIIKGHKESRDSLKDGEVGFRWHGDNRKIWVIKLAPGQYRNYLYYVWEQANRYVPSKHHLEWIDDSAPLTIDNIRVVKNNIHEQEIGQITTRPRLGRMREYIKTGPDQFLLHETYVWQQNHGEIPNGYHVAIKNPEKPITIDNLELRHNSRIAEGAANLLDWWVAGTINKGLSPEAKAALRQDADTLEIQRLRLELSRELKSKHGNARGNTPGPSTDTTDNTVEGTPSENDQ